MLAPVDISVPQPIALAKPHQLDVLLAWDCDCDCDCEIVLRDINPQPSWTVDATRNRCGYFLH